VILAEEPRAANAAGQRRVFLDQLGDMPNQDLHWKPDPRLQAGVQRGMLRLEFTFAATRGGHARPKPASGTDPDLAAAECTMFSAIRDEIENPEPA